MIKFQRTIPISIPILNKYIQRSIDAEQYSNNGPNVAHLTSLLEKQSGVGVVLTANATLALDGLHHIMQYSGAITASIPSFTFPATNQGCRVDNIYHSKTDPFTLVALHSDKVQFDYTITTVPFGAKRSLLSLSNIPVSPFTIIDNAAGYDVDLISIKTCLQYADAVVVSFHATKTLSGCEGGAVFFRSTRLYDEYKRYINFGFYTQADGNRTASEIGSNHKMSELSAACILHYLEQDKYTNILKEQEIKRKQVADELVEHLPSSDYLIGSGCVWINTHKDAHLVSQQFKKGGVEAKPYYTPFFGDPIEDPVGYAYSKQGLCLPTHMTKDDEIQLVKSLVYENIIKDRHGK